SDPTARRCKDIKFAFDRIFTPESSNEEVFDNTTKPILDKFLGGFNCSVFAYGSTGSGKTHTMLGKTGNLGIMQLTVGELFDRLNALHEDYICDLNICYFEVYNETVRDLLKPENGVLSIRENGLSGVLINNLSFHEVNLMTTEVAQLLNFGNQNRTQHPTDANKESSRSHAIYLKQRPKTANTTTEVVSSKLSLIDLAGSERATATKNCGERFREGANINKSLLALGNCINALACGRKGAHIPYRDSKLTRILKDSLGGSCFTVMIANVRYCSFHYEDTFNTLKYADRAKQIKTDARKNTFRFDEHVHRYAAIIDELRQEVNNTVSP
ncbi:unnamed protein product, partial [Soboliphyme baturini]|uniref:Kinesin-like protein n=1 Tax=Soboliphyme baturini TaxID=241478 RepID=A0A183IQN1_9BILA